MTELFWPMVFFVGAAVVAFVLGYEWGKCEEEIRQTKINLRKRE